MANQRHPSPSHPAPSHPTPEAPDLPGPEEAVFRETFLTKFIRRYDHVAARSFGELLADMVRDFEGCEPEVGESWYFREMRAGAADLRLLEEFFRAFHAQRLGNSMDADEHDLCYLGREVAADIAKIAERVEDAVGPAPER